MARIVPMGIERWASFRSPERFEPAMIPVRETHTEVENVHFLRRDQMWSFKRKDESAVHLSQTGRRFPPAV